MNTVSTAPALYWIAVPTLGLGLEAIGVHTGRPIRFHKSVLALLGLLAFVAYGSDVFSFSSRNRVVALDNGLMVTAVLATALVILVILLLAGDSIKGGKPKLTTPLIGSLAAGLLLLAGAVVAEIAQIEPIVNFLNDKFNTSINLADWLSLNGTSFREGLRVAFVGAAVVGAISGVHHFAHKIWGRSLNAGLGLLAVLAASLGTVVWAAGSIAAGFAGQAPWPLVDPGADSTIEAFNMTAAAGAAILALGAAVFVLNIAVSLVAGKGSATEPWRGVTLEWATASPPARGNFETAPVVTSATPLADDASNGEDA